MRVWVAAPNQWQPQPPPPQQPPPPLDIDGVDLAEAPFEDPLGALKTDSCSVFLVLAHFGQAISCVLLKTMRS